MKKSLIAVMTAIVILISTLAPLIQTVQSDHNTDPTSWYMTVPGVLDSDRYSLYPYYPKSLTIGFSKFGELIDAVDHVGLSYGPTDLDPFANDGFVPEFEWNQGWLISITYSYSGEFRNVWAFALYSDSYLEPDSIGGNWKRADQPDSTTVLGGRKYGGFRYGNGTYIPQGYASTEPITVLYNGPRKFVALCKNTIGESAQQPLVGVDITIVFDKVKKYVTLYKDVKLLDTRKFTGTLQVEFSNRGEWDLGKATAPASYAHWFDNEYTCYHSGYHPFYAENANYDVAQIISQSTPGFVGWAAYWPSLISKWMEATYLTGRGEMLTSLETYTAEFISNGETREYALDARTNNPEPVSYPRGAGIWDDAPMVFVDGRLRPMDSEDPLGWTWSSPYVYFNNAPLDDAVIWINYKQLVHKVDMSDEPKVPYIIGEWDFDLSWADPEMSTNHFRGVTVYGVTDYNDGIDPDMEEGAPKIDREVQYQLDEVFNPFGLYDAVEKKSSRWVEFAWGSNFPWTSDNKPVMDVPDEYWDQYAEFSERVIDMNTSKLLGRWQYTFSVNKYTGYATISGSVFNASHYYKILYSTDTEYANWGPFQLSEEWIGTTGLGDFDASDTVSFEDWLGATHTIELYDAEFEITVLTELAVGDNFTISGSENFYIDDFKVFKEGHTEIDCFDMYLPWYHYEANNFFGINFTYLNIDWLIDPPAGLDLHMDLLSFDVEYELFVIYNGTSGQLPTWNVTATFDIVPSYYMEGAPIYAEHIPGRYEWITAGRDADTVDSVGAANVAAAFKNKQVEIGMGAMDMAATTPAYSIPWLLSKSGTGDTFQSYWITPDTTTPGQRTALADDWCTTYPVASSNIINVGGPLANQVTGYFNEFTDAFYAAPWFTPYTPFKGDIVALSCWSKNSYSNNATTGYAMIGAYLDLNGTVGLNIFGLDARDTYYATKFFHEEIIFELQNFPHSATSIIIEIDYTDAKHPTFTIPEVLGTISETTVEMVKGGIHPDP